jgi:diketogulonate reductase-like aldo/keto reductase
VKAACSKQLNDWGLEYFDLLLIHFPCSLQYVDPAHRYPPEWWGDDGKTVTLGKNEQLYGMRLFVTFSIENVPLQETWKAMEDLVDEGKAKNIGIRSAFPFSSCCVLHELNVHVKVTVPDHCSLTCSNTLVTSHRWFRSNFILT